MSILLKCNRYLTEHQARFDQANGRMPYVIGITGTISMVLGLLLLRKVWNPKDKFQFVNQIIAIELAAAAASISWAIMYSLHIHEKISNHSW